MDERQQLPECTCFAALQGHSQATPTGKTAQLKTRLGYPMRLPVSLRDESAWDFGIAQNVRDSAFAFYSRHSFIMFTVASRTRLTAAGERREAGGVITETRRVSHLSRRSGNFLSKGKTHINRSGKGGCNPYLLSFLLLFSFLHRTRAC